ncbi:3,4-dihydroxy 2-butanone 4-phosphate synthase / GTP cyclohydrolase II [Georgenia satyanarayanai]|uniref:GTP cyclohydrolase-2 n=1 Tax=Georgenia satyanarayanai TaxID=860221 RepID=A0A2Y9ACC5_9MICO|nr:GTP cyclohydrolase II [Georgenia satyanarayanai]PYG00132.1 3,4-dihydroxy 2-butanone 4-phosphate synthase/GTP cyclohydrolase II [Georgenia satyanarayanai]SSA40209.1 3,4-dihydroxy 2-butanone 4-phosphate synthase / GTP cyclohydrolase II [Georgenia satyanarayanai]
MSQLEERAHRRLPPDAPVVEREVETVLPTRHGPFRMLGYRDVNGTTHVALVRGLTDPGPLTTPLVRVHSECLTGDAFGSWRCDCGEQLDAALAAVAAEGEGAVVYVRGHEGRGIGLLEKLRAYALQDLGADTVDANVALGHAADARSYDQSADILRDLGISRVRLLSSNPAKEEALTDLGIEVTERVSLIVPAHPQNETYLATKRERMRHDRPLVDDPWQALLGGAVPVVGPQDAAHELVDRYGPLVSLGTDYVIGQLGQSLDGFIASRTGDAEFVTGEADREHLHRMRALVDAVVVGVGTVTADDPRLTVRAVPGHNPVRVVLDPRGRAPLTSRLLTDGAAPTLWLLGPGATAPTDLPEHVDVVRLDDDGPADPVRVLGLLRGRGLGRVLVEGGGRVVSAFLRAGVLDRLYLTTAPVLIGDGVPGLRFAGSDLLADAIRTGSRRFLLGEDVCTELDLRALRSAEEPAP